MEEADNGCIEDECSVIAVVTIFLGGKWQPIYEVVDLLRAATPLPLRLYEVYFFGMIFPFVGPSKSTLFGYTRPFIRDGRVWVQSVYDFIIVSGCEDMWKSVRYSLVGSNVTRMV